MQLRESLFNDAQHILNKWKNSQDFDESNSYAEIFQNLIITIEALDRLHRKKQTVSSTTLTAFKMPGGKLKN